jgi:thiamine biosynthesis lipoprotein
MSVTVLDDRAARADAAATALFVAGPEDWPRIARRLAVDAVLVVQSDGVVVMTPSMVERVDVLTDAPTEVRTLR